MGGSYSELAELAEKLPDKGEAWEKRRSRQGSSELRGTPAARVAVDLTVELTLTLLELSSLPYSTQQVPSPSSYHLRHFCFFSGTSSLLRQGARSPLHGHPVEAGRGEAELCQAKVWLRRGSF